MDYNKGMELFKVQNLLKIILSINLMFLLSCSEDAAEDDVAKTITVSVTPSAPSVLPTDLKYDVTNAIYETCVTTGVKGPRVRYSNIQLDYAGASGVQLLILFIKVTFADPDLAGVFETVITPTTGKSTVSKIFGVSTDFLTPGNYNSTNGNCYVDFGNMPKLKNKLIGSQTATVLGKLFLQGVEKDSDNNETPFSKEVEIQATYFSASTL